MPDDKKLDPFKPQQPSIPGVPGATRPVAGPVQPTETVKTAERATIPMPPAWIMMALAGALLFGIGVAWWSHGSQPKDAAPPSESASVALKPVPPPKPAEKLPVAPGVVATSDQLEKPWSARRFIFHNQITAEMVDAMVVRLPSGEYWGFSLREPYGTCELEYITDLQKLRTDYNFRATHPMVTDPCNNSVFDLTKYGNSPGGLVRGEIVQGVAVRPPIAIEIEADGKQIRAVHIE
jgi:hypothetical protein